MKRFILSLLLMVGFCMPAMAASNNSAPKDSKVKTLLNAGLQKLQDKIDKETKNTAERAEADSGSGRTGMLGIKSFDLAETGRAFGSSLADRLLSNTMVQAVLLLIIVLTGSLLLLSLLATYALLRNQWRIKIHPDQLAELQKTLSSQQ